MSDDAFPRDPYLTAIAIAYRNDAAKLIADGVFPRSGVGKVTFGYTSYPDGQSYTVPDTQVGERSQLPEVTLKGTPQTAKVVDQGLRMFLTADDISQAPKTVDPRGKATEFLTDLVLLGREVRAASLAFDPLQYDADHKVDLSANINAKGAGYYQWDQDPSTHADSNPVTFMAEYIENATVRPNVVVFGHRPWLKFSTHPKVVSAALGNSGNSGRATRERVAELLEVDEVLVGRAFVNIVKPGKTPVVARTWGNHALAFYRDLSVTTAGGITFGLTAEFGTRIAGSKAADIGLRGGQEIRSGESVKEIIIAPKACMFFQNVNATP